MAAVSKLEVTNIFADDSTSTVSIDNIKTSNLNVDNIKQTVKNFNNNSGGDLSTKMRNKRGFNWTGIKRVRIITTDRNYIF